MADDNAKDDGDTKREMKDEKSKRDGAKGDSLQGDLLF